MSTKTKTKFETNKFSQIRNLKPVATTDKSELITQVLFIEQKTQLTKATT